MTARVPSDAPEYVGRGARAAKLESEYQAVDSAAVKPTLEDWVKDKAEKLLPEIRNRGEELPGKLLRLNPSDASAAGSGGAACHTLPSPHLLQLVHPSVWVEVVVLGG